jgi:L-lactate dehydrogenase complex protein LldG
MVATRARGAAVSARDDVLARIRAANASGGPRPGGPGTAESGEPLRRAYRQRGDLSTARLLDLFADRVADYRAKVRRTTAAGLASEIGAALEERGACRVVIPAGLDLPALPAGIELILDQDLPANVLDGCDGVITGAAVAIAETGTIVLDGSPGQGRRAITLVPDYHLCIVRAGQVVALAGEALAVLSPQRPLTWISGPSATSDIELQRVEGVHGPRTLEVILIEPGDAGGS